MLACREAVWLLGDKVFEKENKSSGCCASVALLLERGSMFVLADYRLLHYVLKVSPHPWRTFNNVKMYIYQQIDSSKFLSLIIEVKYSNISLKHRDGAIYFPTFPLT